MQLAKARRVRGKRTMIQRSVGDGVFDVFNHLFMILFAVSIIYPFWNIFLLSFRDAQETATLGLHVWNKRWHLTAYEYLLENSKIGIAYANTIFRTAVGTALAVSVSTMAAYSMSKRNLPGRNAITIYYLIPMFFSGGLIPSYLLIRSLGLMNNRFALILPVAVSSFSVIVIRNFLMAIDKELEESALMDGAGYIRILLSIIVPLSKPVLATVSLWAAVGHWNAWFDAMIYIRDENKVVLQLLLRRMIQMTSVDMVDMMNKLLDNQIVVHTAGVIAAATIVTIGPIIMVYPFLQKYFVKGIMIGSLKG